ncbi:uncharacterized protein [Coffea arabica]|uniref:Uncharacterized protein n=1 Tax=Coffea arabica TaxID=13443 RepID=A0A6P6T3T7_COFAR|nr:uncharacterized protein LOC113697540 [Coffea arabica]
MGNCIAPRKKAIKVIKSDGRVLEYNPPMKVCHVLSIFGGHALYDSLPVVRHLHPDTDMIGGRVYYLLPLLTVHPQRARKAGDVSGKITATGQEGGVLRIKLVISKEELQAMLRKGGITVDNMVSKLQNNGKTYGTDSFSSDSRRSSPRWMPLLESVPEGN